MKPVQIDAQPVCKRLKLIGRRNRSARQPFVSCLGGNRMLASVAQIKMQSKLRPTHHFFRAALQSELEALGERHFFFKGWHQQIVQSRLSR